MPSVRRYILTDSRYFPLRIDLVAHTLLNGSISQLISSSARVVEGAMAQRQAFLRPAVVPGSSGLRAVIPLDESVFNAPSGLFSLLVKASAVYNEAALDANTAVW